MKRSTSVLAVVSVLLGGCSSLPAFVNEHKPGDATITGYNGTMSKAISGEPVIMLKEIDGFRKKATEKPPLFVRPGHHEIGVEIGGLYVMFQKQGAEFLELEFQADHSYSLKCTSVDSNFSIDFVDETDPKSPTVVKTTKVKGSWPTIVPIPIPIK